MNCALHDRLGATTVYVTHDQLEAMAMADKIAVMNNGVIEQVEPAGIYDRPASLFVADFIGSPPMNFLPFRGSLRGRAGDPARGARSTFPTAREALAESDLVLGVRPEHVRFSDRRRGAGRGLRAEYLGTTQIVTVDDRATAWSRRGSPASFAPDRREVGLDFRPEKLSIFDKASGRAIRTALHEGGAHG